MINYCSIRLVHDFVKQGKRLSAWDFAWIDILLEVVLQRWLLKKQVTENDFLVGAGGISSTALNIWVNILCPCNQA